MEKLPFTPVIILGAGRSGTNALRDSISRLPDFATWPCDEINPIWRHGNVNHPDDEIPPEKATSKVREFVRAAFMRIWRQQGRPDFVVEKTCANTLRVPFVDAIFPEAQYIHLVRNGMDVVASAEKRWRGELEFSGIPYYLAKARYAPFSDLPAYAVSALRNRLRIALGQQEHFDYWGPRIAGFSTLYDRPLDEIVAHQWAACVLACDRALGNLENDRVLNLKYEDLTANAVGSLNLILSWLRHECDQATVVNAAATVRSGSVGKGKDQELSKSVLRVLEQPMQAHGYLREVG